MQGSALAQGWGKLQEGEEAKQGRQKDCTTNFLGNALVMKIRGRTRCMESGDGAWVEAAAVLRIFAPLT